MTQEKFWIQKTSKLIKDKPNLLAIRSWKIIRKENPKKLLDIGCGRSRDIVYFANKGILVDASDISKNRIESVKSYVKHKKIENINFIVTDTKDLKIKKNYYDVIYSHLSLHYFDEKTLNRILNRIYKGLKKEGFLFLKWKSMDDPEFGVGKKIDKRTFDNNGHIKSFFDIEYSKRLLKKFKIFRIRRSSGKYQGHKLTSKYIEVFARR